MLKCVRFAASAQNKHVKSGIVVIPRLLNRRSHSRHRLDGKSSGILDFILYFFMVWVTFPLKHSVECTRDSFSGASDNFNIIQLVSPNGFSYQKISTRTDKPSFYAINHVSTSSRN